MMAQPNDAKVPKPTAPGNNGTDNGGKKKRRKRKRWGDAPPGAAAAQALPAAPAVNAAAALDPKAKALALQESIRAKLAALKGTTGAVKHPAEAPPIAQPPVKKAKQYELDLSTTAPTFQQKPALPKKKVNPYLAHQEDGEGVDEKQDVDERLVRSSKPRQRHKPIHFVEPGTFVELAERKRQKAANAAQSGFVSGRKAGMYIESTGMANVYGSSGVDDGDYILPPRPDASTQTRAPQIMEWWDVELLPSKLKKQVAAQEGKALSKQTQVELQQLDKNQDDSQEVESVEEATMQLQKQCWEQASLSNSKTSTLVQHIVPVKPPGADDGPAKQPTLHLTKKELKRQRKQRREEKQRRIQDEQAVGLRPPPEPRLTLKNFIKVLGDQAVLDPSQMEQKVVEQIEARQRAHLERNEARKLTKEQRREKKASKLTEDTSISVSVALFFVKDMSHTYHRTKVDLNAQQNYITGGVLECANPPMACVICEGGPKAIKRYTRLMLVRMNWTGQGLEEEEVDEEQDAVNDGEATTRKFNPDNKCELVWTGMCAKRMFSSFVFQSCETASMARKVLEAKGVAHFWDQVMTHASGQGESFNLKLADSDEEEDIVMMEE